MKKISRAIAALGLTIATAFTAAPAASALDGGELVAGSLGGPQLITAEQWARDGRTPLVVFGARLEADCFPPEILNARLNRAALFAAAHPGNPIYVSGGFTRAGCPSEARAMETGLRFRGVRNPIIVEEHSYSTWENATNVIRMSNSPRFIVVSNAWHEDRARDSITAQGRAAVALNLFH